MAGHGFISRSSKFTYKSTPKLIYPAWMAHLGAETLLLSNFSRFLRILDNLEALILDEWLP